MNTIVKKTSWSDEIINKYPNAKGLPGEAVIRIAATRHVDNLPSHFI